MPSPADGPTGGYRNAPTGAPPVDSGPGAAPPGWTPPEGGVLWVDVSRLERAADTFREAATAAARAAGATPRADVSSGVPPWGADPLGTAFGNGYAEVAARLPDALRALTALLGGTADRLSDAGHVFAAAEDRVLDDVRTFGRPDGRD